MRYSPIAMLALVCALGSVSATTAPTPAPVQPLVSPAPPIDHLMVDGDDYVVPTPEHFCASTLFGDAMRVQMESLVAASVNSIWVGCDLVSTDPASLVFGFVAVKPSPVVKNQSRAELIKAMAAELQSAQGAALVHQGVQEGQSKATDLGMPTPKLTSEPHLVASDDYGVYCIAAAGVPTATGSKGIFIVEAITLVKGRLVLIAFGRVDPSTDAQADLVNKAKAEARRMVDVNETSPA
jgi:hypothetical protein